MPAADAALVQVLKRDRAVVATALGVLTLLAWAYVVFLSSHMAVQTGIPEAETLTAAPFSGMAGMGTGAAASDDRAGMDMTDIGVRLAPAIRAWAPADFGFMFAMWSVMMIGMMTPSVAPMVLLYAAAGRKAAEGGIPFASTGWFFAGYIAVWIAFSALATLLQWGLTKLALLTPMMTTNFQSKSGSPRSGGYSRGGRAIQDLKPCFMMSPLSLAKFLPRTMTFDLLVIDEASQMKPEDALGGMLRAKQIVVVGDPKQLPPTDFFNRSSETSPADTDDDFEDVDDESILEGCEKAFREVRRLKWHYRSKCESLIAFSNVEFYDNGLITFPTAKPGSFSVDLIRVDGDYRARRNPAEASRVAQEAIRFMRHFADHEPEEIPTLGIVSVNIDQRDLIREELRRLSADDELVKLYREKTDNKGEDVFVKNLENVQGDERDFMFISLTRGRAAGATVMKSSLARSTASRATGGSMSCSHGREVGSFCLLHSDQST